MSFIKGRFEEGIWEDVFKKQESKKKRRKKDREIKKGSKRKKNGKREDDIEKGKTREEEKNNNKNKKKRNIKQQRSIWRKGFGEKRPKPCQTARNWPFCIHTTKKPRTKPQKNKRTEPKPKKVTKQNKPQKKLKLASCEKNAFCTLLQILWNQKYSRKHYKIGISANLKKPNWTNNLSGHFWEMLAYFAHFLLVSNLVFVMLYLDEHRIPKYLKPLFFSVLLFFKHHFVVLPNWFGWHKKKTLFLHCSKTPFLE